MADNAERMTRKARKPDIIEPPDDIAQRILYDAAVEHRPRTGHSSQWMSWIDTAIARKLIAAAIATERKRASREIKP